MYLLCVLCFAFQSVLGLLFYSIIFISFTSSSKSLSKSIFRRFLSLYSTDVRCNLNIFQQPEILEIWIHSRSGRIALILIIHQFEKLCKDAKRLMISTISKHRRLRFEVYIKNDNNYRVPVFILLTKYFSITLFARYMLCTKWKAAFFQEETHLTSLDIFSVLGLNNETAGGKLYFSSSGKQLLQWQHTSNFKMNVFFSQTAGLSYSKLFSQIPKDLEHPLLYVSASILVSQSTELLSLAPSFC